MGSLIKGEYTYGEIIRRGEMNEIVIGKFCSIAKGVIFDSGFNHRTDFISTFPFKTILDCNVENNVRCNGDIIIGNDVWIAENVTIMSGIKIGNGAVIGNGSIVTKDVNPYTIVAGNPAKYIKQRFSFSQIIALELIEWWNWDIQKIKDNAHYLNGGDIEEFINLYLNK